MDGIRVVARHSFLGANGDRALTVEASRTVLAFVVAQSMKTTALERWLRSRKIKPVDLARDSGYSRQHVYRVRMGRIDPTRRCIASITAACWRLSGEPVRAEQLFDLG
jgi:hypothetical protein